MGAKAVQAPDRAAGKAKREAQRLLNQFGGGLPVDVEAIARAQGLSVRAESLEESTSGMLVIKDGGGVIAVNQAHHRNRQRFSVAHELGHYVLHRNSAKVFIDAVPVFYRDEVAADGTHLQEIQANAFAAELLMPESTVREMYQRQPVDPHDEAAVKRMAARFEVSAQALTLRLAKLGLVA
jgi:Zn-dependent peptidase ImmA (M78 family)